MDPQTQESPVISGEGVFVRGERETWAEKYLAFCGINLAAHSDLVRGVDSDDIDNNRIETEIAQLIPSIEVVKEFCGKCQHLLSHWPDPPTADFDSVVARTFDSTSEVEAAARLRCKFCAFIFWRLIYEQLLDTSRKIEWRLVSLGYDRSTTINIKSWPGSGESAAFEMFLSLPGKTATDCRYLGCDSVWFRSDVVNPSGMIGTIYSCAETLSRYPY